MDPRIIYILPFFLASSSILGVGLYTFLKYPFHEGRYLVGVCLAAAWWSACEGLLYLGSSPDVNVIITQVQYLGIIVMPPMSLLFAVQLFGNKTWITRKRIILLFVIPVISLVMAWTNGSHGLVWSRYWAIKDASFPMLGLDHGTYFWFMTSYIYILLLCCFLIVLRHFLDSVALHRAQALLVLIALSLVWLLNALYLLGLNPIPNMDFTPLGFSLITASMTLSFYRFRLLDIMPVAKTEIFRSFADGVLVLDPQCRIIDLNPAATDLLRVKSQDAIGRDAWDLFREIPELAFCLKNRTPGEVAITWEQNKKTYDLRLSPLTDRKKRPLGVVVVLRDISERKRLESQLEWLATIDPLTEVNNRRHFFEKGQMELLRAQRYRHPLSILMIDIDHFKLINDRFGHHGGDLALKAMTRRCLDDLRETDAFGRVGGEEFAAILPETNRDLAWQVAERLRKDIADLKVAVDDQVVQLTVSIGIASGNHDKITFEQLLDQADQALYQAKADGRNCTRVFKESPTAPFHLKTSGDDRANR